MRKFWKQQWPGLVLLAGMAAIAVGAGMIYLPAGVIAGGALAIAWWLLDSLDNKGGDRS